MRKLSRGATTRRRAIVALAAAAAAVAAGTALAHESVQTATRGLAGISEVDHPAVPSGSWTFEVTSVQPTGKVRNLTLVIKSPQCAHPMNENLWYTQISKPKVGDTVTTPPINADASTATDDYCSHVSFPGGGTSVTVKVTHPS